MQENCKIYKSNLKSKLHQRSCIKNLRDDKNILLDEISESYNIVTKVTEDNTNKSSKIPPEEFENTINEAYDQIVFWKKNLFCLPSNNAG